MVLFQSMATVHKHPGGVVNRMNLSVNPESSHKGGCKVEDTYSVVY